MNRIGSKKKPGSFNFREAKKKKVGCMYCEHNPMGICEKVRKEIGLQYVLHNCRPVWCPLLKKGKRK